MRAIIFILLFSLAGTASAQWDLLKIYLPSSQRDRVKDFLTNLELTETKLSSQPSLTFISGESTGSNGEEVVNQVYFFETAKIDFWLMRQAISPTTLPVSSRNLFGIVIDKTLYPKESYYLEFAPKPTDEGLHVIPFTAACFTCHASGPRVIRPKRTLAGKSELLQVWNEKIASYRGVKTHLPEGNSFRALPPIHLNETEMNQPLQIPLCLECHNDSYETRGPLLRQHGNSIKAMIKNGSKNGLYVSAELIEQAFMPLDSPKLNEHEIFCLENWLANVGHPTCNKKGEPI